MAEKIIIKIRDRDTPEIDITSINHRKRQVTFFIGVNNVKVFKE